MSHMTQPPLDPATPPDADHGPHLERCVQLAQEALEAGDHPFGSVLVSGEGRALAEARNRERSLADPTAHPDSSSPTGPATTSVARNVRARPSTPPASTARCARQPTAGSGRPDRLLGLAGAANGAAGSGASPRLAAGHPRSRCRAPSCTRVTGPGQPVRRSDAAAPPGSGYQVLLPEPQLLGSAVVHDRRILSQRNFSMVVEGHARARPQQPLSWQALMTDP